MAGVVSEWETDYRGREVRGVRSETGLLSIVEFGISLSVNWGGVVGF